MSEGKTINRRTFLRGVVFGGGAAMLAACGTGPAAPPAPAAGATAAPAAPAAPAAGGAKELTILWAEWDPANYLQELVNEYQTVAGVKVNVLQEPWPSFGNRTFAEFAAKGTSYDMVVGDSQWLGQGATQGHYVELTNVFNTDLNGTSLAPATVTYYAEYPKGSAKYWAYPLEGDACGWAYRKDLLEDPAEKTAFKEKYSYDLAVPKTWTELRDIAEFFTRPDKNLYGLTLYTQKEGDAITMGVQNVLFSWGSDWGDPQTFKVDGVLNSAAGVEALEFYRELYKFVPPGSSNDFFQEALNKYTSGQVALSMNYYAFFPGLANPATNPFADKTGFFSSPAGPTGQSFAALGGQGISIVSYINAEKQAASMAFLKWLAKDETQQTWAELGGYTCNNNILNSKAFLENTPFNPSFAESMQKVKDFWAVPVYADLLTISQTEFHKHVVNGEGTAKDSLDSIARQHEEVFKKAGLLKG
jgi:multiple sugar transport system substrate-binding protein